MFGYIRIHKDELKVKEYKRYQSYYCGVCKSLQAQYGVAAQMTLNYDMSFLGLVLTALYEDETQPKAVRCVPHPTAKHEALRNEYTSYAASMNVLLAYYKCEDDWEDDRNLPKKGAALTLKRSFKKAVRQYPRQAQAIADYIRKQHEAETQNAMTIEEVASLTGEMLGELFCYQDDMWKDKLKRMGFNLGKFIYIMDAFDDVENDRRHNHYNPLIPLYEEDESENHEVFHNRVKKMLTDLAAESSRAFESLPVLMDAEIIRNILYAGIWLRYEEIVRKRNERTTKEQTSVMTK